MYDLKRKLPVVAAAAAAYRYSSSASFGNKSRRLQKHWFRIAHKVLFSLFRVVKSFLPACVKRSKLVLFGNVVKNTTSATAATNSRLVATPI